MRTFALVVGVYSILVAGRDLYGWARGRRTPFSRGVRVASVIGSVGVLVGGVILIWSALAS